MIPPYFVLMDVGITFYHLKNTSVGNMRYLHFIWLMMVLEVAAQPSQGNKRYEFPTVLLSGMELHLDIRAKTGPT